MEEGKGRTRYRVLTLTLTRTPNIQVANLNYKMKLRHCVYNELTNQIKKALLHYLFKPYSLFLILTKVMPPPPQLF